MVSVNLWKSDNPASTVVLINNLGKFVQIKPIGDSLPGFLKRGTFPQIMYIIC